jgi:UDP-2-acetamido-2,6-beta-L-arabino-hexul-4-ose reductase
MTESLVRIVTVPDTGDDRGCSFSLPDTWNQFLSSLSDLHITTIGPTHTRGNHYHARHREILVVVYRDAWMFYWDSGAGSSVEHRSFTGKGAAMIEILPFASHALVNTGKRDLIVAGMSDVRYNPEHPDAFPRPVVQGPDYRSG